jgi:hypothetical protein
MQREYSRKNINIIIGANHKENYINIDFANQLLITEPSIIEKKNSFGKKNMKLRTYK